MHFRGWRRSLTGFMVASALASCSQNNEQVPGRPSMGQSRAGLQAFSGPNACADLEQYIEDTAVLEMKANINRMRDWNFGPPMAAMGGTAEASAMPDAKGSSAPNDYTTTNTQVAGVDEADFVKNDGTRIFVLSGDTLYSTLSWPASSLGLQGKLKIEGWPREMFLADNNRVVVFSQVSIPEWDDAAGKESVGRDAAPGIMEGGCYYSPNGVKVTVIDATSLAAPVVEREVYLPGNYSNSRRIQDSVRVVLSGALHYPRTLRYYPNVNDPAIYEDTVLWNAELDTLAISNELAIRGQNLDQWLPVQKEKQADGTWKNGTRDCTNFHRNTGSTQLGILTVATLNLSNPSSLEQTNVVAQVGEVYASSKNLYVTNYRWWWDVQPGQKDATYIHKFDISQPLKATYVASGEIEGHIINQFAMDEAASGHLRVATTTSTVPMQNSGTWTPLETVNHVRVLAEQNGALQVVGSSEPLAEGERIFSARFVEDKGYVVTFRQVDPLFTFDLSNPTQPVKIGELKIPGFSSYIHPIGPNHLLTIGTYIPENPNQQGDFRNVQLSIFDVTDMANPKQTFNELVGSSWAYSEAQWEHKAFNYFAAKKLLAIPFFDWNSNGSDYWSSYVSDLRVYEVDPVTGFKHKGNLDMADMFREVDTQWGWTYYWAPYVRRSVMADDFVYAISDAGIRVANVASLSTPVATVEFEKMAP